MNISSGPAVLLYPLFGLPKFGILFLRAKTFLLVFHWLLAFKLAFFSPQPCRLIGVAKVRRVFLLASRRRKYFFFSFLHFTFSHLEENSARHRESSHRGKTCLASSLSSKPDCSPCRAAFPFLSIWECKANSFFLLYKHPPQSSFIIFR